MGWPLVSFLGPCTLLHSAPPSNVIKVVRLPGLISASPTPGATCHWSILATKASDWSNWHLTGDVDAPEPRHPVQVGEVILVRGADGL